MAKHSDNKAKKVAPAEPSAGSSKGSAGDTSEGTPHQMIVAVATLLAFGFAAVMVAGIGPKSGKFVVGILVLMTFVQVLTHVNPIVDWSANHPLIPGQQTLTVNGGNK